MIQRWGVETMKAAFGLLAILLAVAGPAMAHHSFSMFDMKKELVLDAVVTEFQWTNPHIWIEIDVLDGKGGAKHWSVEGGAVAGLSRQGWKRSTLKPGDKIRIAIHPLHNGTAGGSLIGVELPDGRKLGAPVEKPAADAAR